MKEEFKLRPQGDATEIQPEDSKAASEKLSTPQEVEKHPSAPEIPGYILVSQIGQGAYAQVWKAWQTRTRKWVAIKVYIQTTGVNWLFLQREVERLIRLDKHPHIVSLLDADLNANPPYYVMDYMAGGALDQFVSPGNSAPPQKAAAWMEEICRALAFVHSKGLIHCDLKPANILLDEEGHVRVADFGQSRIVTESSWALGTLFYMAPEQAVVPKEGEPLQPDVGWDIYGLGATMWSVLTGQVPHGTEQIRKSIEAAQNLAERLRIYHESALTRPLPACGTAAPAVDQDLGAIIDKCAQGKAEDRHRTVGEVLDDLQSRRERRPVSPLASSNAYRIKRFIQRNAVPLIITVAAAAALTFSITQTIRDRNSATRKLAQSYILQAHNYAEKGDYPSAVTYYAESCRLVPSHLARANALAYMAFLPKILKNNEKKVIAAAFSPDGKTVITGSREDKALISWDAHTGQRLNSFETHDKDVTSLTFSPDSKTILTGSDDGTARLWKSHNGEPVGKAMQHDKNIMAVAFSPDGRSILTGSVDKTVRQWEARSGKPVGKPLQHAALVSAVAYSPDGKTILTGCDDNTARLWDARSGEPRGKVMRHNAWVLAAAFNPDGKTLLTGSEDKGVRLWNARSGEQIGKTMYHDGIVEDVAFSPDGRTILSGGDNTARLWSAATGEQITKLIGHTSWVNAAAFSPDGTVILTGSSDKTARLWDIQRGKPIVTTLKNNTEALAIAFSPDLKTLAAASVDNSVRLWNIQSGETIGKTMKHNRRLRVVAFSPDGRTILTGGDDKAARLWDARSGEPIGKVMDNNSTVLGADFSADSKIVLTRGWGAKIVRLWDAHTGEPIGKNLENTSGVSAVTFSPDGKTIITVDYENTIKRWDMLSGLQIGKVIRLNETVYIFAYSNDGNTIFTGTSEDNTFRLRNANSGKHITKSMKHNGRVTAIVFSPDDRTILTGSDGNTAQLWDALTGEPIGSDIVHNGSVLAVAFSADGKTAYTAGADNTIRSWDTAWLSAAKDISVEKLLSMSQASTGYRVNEHGDIELIPASK